MSYGGYYKGSGGSRGRGGFRSGDYGGGGGGGGGGSRGRVSSRGRYGWYKERSSGFEPRSRYISGGGGGGGGGKYSEYRRYRDEIGYSGRERYRRSPEISRKRIRSEHSYLQLSDDDDELIGCEIDIRKKVKKIKKEKPETKDDEPEEGEEMEEVEGEGEEGENEEKKKKKKKTVEKSNANDKKEDSDAQSDEDDDDDDKPIYDLTCPHCRTQYESVGEYKLHLYSQKHGNNMRKISLLHKQNLQRMRMNQRLKQRIIEESDELRHSISDRTKFCPICKLNYKQPKSTHMTSEDHEEMVRFLNPFCRICKQGFSTPMFYEHHLCSLDHIKFKAIVGDKMKSDDEEGGKDVEKELNLDNFMILDSVGSVDETGEDGESAGDEKAAKPEGEGAEENEKDKNKENDADKEKDEAEDKEGTQKEGEKEGKKDDKKKKPKKLVNIGSEFTKKVEVYYCELCRLYLPWYEEQEKALNLHCSSRPHLQRYVRHREDKLLKKEAERLHQRRLARRKAEKEARAKKSEKKTSDEKTADGKEGKTEKEGGEKSSEDTAGESPKKKKVENGEATGQDQEGEGADEDLDKEIGSAMDESANKSSDEDEGSRARYDRFQNSEKGSAAMEDDEESGKTPAGGEQNADVEMEDATEKSAESKSEGDSPTKKVSAADTTSAATTDSKDSEAK